MREILFRGKRVDNGEWAESPYPYGTMSSGVVQHDFISQTIGQYTGHTDKNGVKIFEGDICHFFGGEYYSGCWEINLWRKIKIDQECLFYLEEAEYVEVIGNIYDNPDCGTRMDGET